MNVNLDLRPVTPERIRRVFDAIPEIEVTTARRDRIEIDGKKRDLVILPRPQHGLWPDLDTDAKELARDVPRGSTGLVVAAAIPTKEREAMERAGLSWCDGRGALHLTWPGGLVHIDRTARKGSTRATGEPGAHGLGPASIRAIQVLLEHDRTEWTVGQLAQAAAISTGQAHNVLRVLDENRLVVRSGRGPQQRTIIDDRRAALDWLATIDRARRRPKAATTYLYARSDQELPCKFAAAANDAGLPYAITSAAATTLLGAPALSRVVVVKVRVGGLDAPDALARLGLEHLDAEDAGRGANLELWTDTGELGIFNAQDVDGIKVAPNIRVWLDLAREGGRGQDAAQVFREQIVERA